MLRKEMKVTKFLLGKDVIHLVIRLIPSMKIAVVRERNTASSRVDKAETAIVEWFGDDGWIADAEDHFRPKLINCNDPLCGCGVAKGSVATHEERERMPVYFYMFKTASVFWPRRRENPWGDRTISRIGNLR